MAITASLTTPPVGATPTEASDLAGSLYGIEGSVTALGGDSDDNYLIDSPGGSFSLKIANPDEDPATLEMQQLCLEHIAQADPELPVPRIVRTRAGRLTATAPIRGRAGAVRVVTFLEGSSVDPATSASRISLGRTGARLDRALASFRHPALDREYLWDVAQVGDLRPYLHHLDDTQRPFVTNWLDRFDVAIAPRLTRLPRQAIHGDLNPANLVWDPTPSESVCGVFDFGDLIRSARAIEPAIAAAYQCFGHHDLAGVAAEVLGGYHEVNPLRAAEIELVPDLMMARLVQSLTIGAWRADLHPANREYILSDSQASWVAIRSLDAIGTDTVRAAIRAGCESP